MQVALFALVAIDSSTGEWRDSQSSRRRPLLGQDTVQESGLCCRRGVDAGAGDWGEHGDFQRGRECAVATPALSATGKPDANLEYLPPAGSPGAFIPGRLRGLAPAKRQFLRNGRVRSYLAGIQFDRRRRAAARAGELRQRGTVPSSWNKARGRALLHSGGGSCRQFPSGDAESSPMAKPIWGRPCRGRTNDHAGQPALYGGGGAAGRFSPAALGRHLDAYRPIPR